MKKLWNDSLFERLVDDQYRYYLQMQLACMLLGGTGLLMCVINLFTAQWLMAGLTFAFFFVCLLNLLLLRRFKQMRMVNCLIFECSIFALCTYFVITGGADGFSPHWLLILPTCAMTLLGRKRGGVLTGLLFAMLVFFMWVPFGRNLLQYPYGDLYCARFPVVYLVASVIGYGFELSRLLALKQMFKTQDKMRLLSETDRLTGLRNRYWFQERLSRITRKDKEKNGSAAFLLMDIDTFKNINDTYGHKTGDQVLVEVAKELQAAFHKEDLLCRWGGEEFLAYLPSCTAETARNAGQTVCELVRTTKVQDMEGNSIRVTISVGVVVLSASSQVDEAHAFIEADKQLYTAKRNGRDCVSMIVLE